MEIIGNASDFSRALKGAERDTRSFGSGLDRAFGTAVKTGIFAAATAGIAGVAFTLKRGISEWQEQARVGAQTNAVLKSTGGVANVTRGDVDKLSASIMKKTGIDDEQIAAGQNMLLTFTKVRNEVGQGNDIFTQATKRITDVSVALGKDLPSSAMLVGKALNDPIRGMTAMTRAGIQFTDAQKDQIKAMVESGDVMGAQKIILEELETQFGGSAEAIGKTLPGQLDILRERFNNFAGDLVQRAIPAVNRFFDFIGRVGEGRTISAKIDIVLEGVASVASGIWDQIQVAFQGETRRIQTREGVEIQVTKPSIVVDWADVQRQVEEGFSSALDEGGSADILTNKYVDMVEKVEHAVGEWAKGFPGRVAADLRAGLNSQDLSADFQRLIVQPLKNAGLLAIQPAVTIGTNIVTGVRGGIAALGPLMTTTMSQMVATITQRIPAAFSAAVSLGGRVVAGVAQGLSNLSERVSAMLSTIASAIATTASRAAGWAASIGSNIISGVVSGLSGLAGRVAGAIKSGVERGIAAAGRLLHGSGPFQFTRWAVGEPLAIGITEGLRDHLRTRLPRNLTDVLRSSMANTVALDTSVYGKGSDIASTMKGGIDDFLETKLPSNLQSVIGGALATVGVPITAAGLGVTGFTGPLPLTHKASPYGGSIMADPDAGTIVVNINAPIGSERDLENMVVSAFTKVRNRGGLT